MSTNIAILDFDGKIQYVKTDKLRFCLPTMKCVQFWATIVTCFICIGLGVFFMLFDPGDAETKRTYFNVGEAMVALGIGVLIPGPNFGSMKPKTVSADAHAARVGQ